MMAADCRWMVAGLREMLSAPCVARGVTPLYDITAGAIHNQNHEAAS